jgi:D-alanyl-D-alanine carboxypeptidase
VLVLVRDGDRSTVATAGYANLATKAPYTAADRFRVGSVTKSFVATVVLQLAGEGRLSLGDRVDRWLPGRIPNGGAITVRELLNMTSGVPDYLQEGAVVQALLRREWGRRWTPQQLLALAARRPADFEPGARWAYSNTNYVALGLIAERAGGAPLAALIRRRILAPLGLHDTYLDAARRIVGPHAHGYERLSGRLVDASDVNPSYAWAAGAIVSTAGDVARFYRALLRGRLLGRALLAQMETLTSPSPGFGYGLGIFRSSLPCGAAWGHNGSVPGYVTWAGSSRDGSRQVVLSANAGEDTLPAAAQQALLQAAVAAYCG